jgi:hypothetical protein
MRRLYCCLCYLLLSFFQAPRLILPRILGEHWSIMLLSSGQFAIHFGILILNSNVLPSMWPLLKRDGLGIQYIATLLLWNRLIGYNPIRLPLKTFIQFFSLVSLLFALQVPFPDHTCSRLFMPQRLRSIYLNLSFLHQQDTQIYSPF